MTYCNAAAVGVVCSLWDDCTAGSQIEVRPECQSIVHHRVRAARSESLAATLLAAHQKGLGQSICTRGCAWCRGAVQQRDACVHTLVRHDFHCSHTEATIGSAYLHRRLHLSLIDILR